MKIPNALKEVVKSGVGIPRGPRRGKDIPGHQIPHVLAEAVRIGVEQEQQLTQWTIERPPNNDEALYFGDDLYDPSDDIGPDPMVIDPLW